ncbi:MAG: ROK family protein [Parasphingorhabdus sp.]
MAKPKIGFDVGGTKIECIVLNAANDVEFLQRRKTPSDSYAEIISTMQELLENACASAPSDEYTIGVGFPGALTKDDRLVKNANTQVLIGQPFRQDLEKAFGQEVFFANDANCMTLSEAIDGAASRETFVFGVILGTGAGGGIVIDKRVHEGQNRLAGEWGHNPFPFCGSAPKNRQCYCGKTDCIEQIIAGPALSKDYLEAGGGDATAKEIWELADSDNLLAAKVCNDYVENVAKAFASLINVMDPDCIVVGGGVSNVDRLYTDLPDLISKYVFHTVPTPPETTTKILKNRWGDSSGVRGAAWLPNQSV